MTPFNQVRARRLVPLILLLQVACGTETPLPEQTVRSRRQGLSEGLVVTASQQNDGDLRDYTVTLTVTNQGSTDSSNVALTLTLPQGAIVRALSGNGWGCEVLGTSAGCQLAVLAAGAHSQVSVDLELPYGTTNATLAASVQSDTFHPTGGGGTGTVVLGGDPRTIQLDGGGLSCAVSSRAAPASGLLTLGALGMVTLARRRRHARSVRR